MDRDDHAVLLRRIVVGRVEQPALHVEFSGGGFAGPCDGFRLAPCGFQSIVDVGDLAEFASEFADEDLRRLRPRGADLRPPRHWPRRTGCLPGGHHPRSAGRSNSSLPSWPGGPADIGERAVAALYQADAESLRVFPIEPGGGGAAIGGQGDRSGSPPAAGIT